MYCVSVGYQTIASPLMLVVAFSMKGSDGLPQTKLWALIGVATVIMLVGASLLGCFMVPEYRMTFYQVMRSITRMLLFTSLNQPYHLSIISISPSTSLSRRSSSGCGTSARAVR